jgi:hypothetical protein
MATKHRPGPRDPIQLAKLTDLPGWREPGGLPDYGTIRVLMILPSGPGVRRSQLSSSR